jgi:tetratricopeptide (TPR) repeat protein/predicted aspartyl protease
MDKASQRSQRSRIAWSIPIALAAGQLLLAATDGQLPDSLLQRADQFFSQARYQDAARGYEQARAQANSAAPLVVRASIGLVRSLLRVADFTGARREATGLIAKDPGNVDAIVLDGDTLWSLGLFAEAEQRYRDALAIAPEDPHGNQGLARALAARRQLDEALERAQSAVARTPDDHELYYTLAFVYERLGRFTDASAALQQAVARSKGNPKSDELLLAKSQIRFLDAFRGREPFQTDPAVAAETHTVPFRLVHDKVIVRGSVNGSPMLDFVLDTGAEMTVIGQRTADRYGISPAGTTISAGVGEAGIRGLQVGRLDDFQIGSYRVRNVPVLIKNPPGRDLPRREAESFSPLALGLSMTIDYGRRTLTFGRHLDLHGDTELPLYLYRLAVVRGMINGQTPASFVVDTGGEVISISTAMASTLKSHPVRHIPLKVFGSSGWDRDAFLLPGLDLAFDRIRFENFSTVVLNLRAPSVLLGFEVGGIVGHRFLGRYTVGLDLDRGKLTLTALPAASASLRAEPPGGPGPLLLSAAPLPSPR